MVVIILGDDLSQGQGIVTASPTDSPRTANGARRLKPIAFVLIVVVIGSCAAEAAAPRASSAPSSSYAVPATRQPLTTDPESPVAQDTENDVLVAQGSRLFASTDREYPGSPAYGQILVTDSADAPWKVFEQTQGLRVENSMASFPIPADQVTGRGHSLLITVATLHGHNELQWLLDGATSFSPADSFPLLSDVVDVRSFGAHEAGGLVRVQRSGPDRHPPRHVVQDAAHAGL